MRAWKVVLILALGACATQVAVRPLMDRGNQLSTLHVEVSGFKHTDGQLMMSLFTSEEGFPGDADQAFRTLVEPVDATTMNVAFEQLPSGYYALAVLHDENGNSAMERNVFGAPSEGYGFSNDANKRFGPPSFEAASVAVDTDDVSIVVNLRY